MRSAYYFPSETVSLAGGPRGMFLIDELFMFLCRLRLGFVGAGFGCSVQLFGVDSQLKIAQR